MKFLGKWSINNHVTVNLIMIFIIVAGLFTVCRMRREVYPQFALDMINVSVVYPGSSPEEVEEGICIKIEERIKGIEGITRTFASAYEGRGSVSFELDTSADINSVLDDIKNEVDLIAISTHGRSGISRWVWGSVADRVLRSACVPVLMVRAPGCVPGV